MPQIIVTFVIKTTDLTVKINRPDIILKNTTKKKNSNTLNLIKKGARRHQATSYQLVSKEDFLFGNYCSLRTGIYFIDDGTSYDIYFKMKNVILFKYRILQNLSSHKNIHPIQQPVPVSYIISISNNKNTSNNIYTGRYINKSLDINIYI